MHYVETSVKENKNVTEAFDWLADAIYLQEARAKRPTSFNLQDGGKKKETKNNGKCCK